MTIPYSDRVDAAELGHRFFDQFEDESAADYAYDRSPKDWVKAFENWRREENASHAIAAARTARDMGRTDRPSIALRAVARTLSPEQKRDGLGDMLVAIARRIEADAAKAGGA